MPIPLKRKKLDRKSAKTIIFKSLQKWIIDGTLQPGEKIIDKELSDYFSVSRTPVREALQMLAEQNLVEIIPSKGTRVTIIHLENIKHVYEALSIIHSSALELSFSKIDKTVIENLKKLIIK